MQEHRIDGVQLTQQLQGIWVSAHYASQLELSKILKISHYLLFKKEKVIILTLV